MTKYIFTKDFVVGTLTIGGFFTSMLYGVPLLFYAATGHFMEF